jgi:DNA-binding CsgD family transcriptional regulator
VGEDLVAIVEAMYASDVAAETWLRQVAESVRPVLDLDRIGIVAGLYSCPDPCSFTPTAAYMCGLSDPLQSVFLEGLGELSPIFVADSFLSRSCFLGTSVRGWGEVPPVRSGALGAAGAADSLQINAVEPDGLGCWICCPLSKTTRLTDDAHMVLTRLARHLAAAHRLRRKYRDTGIVADEAEAVLERDGTVRAARGEALECRNHAALTHGVRTMVEVRCRPPRARPVDAIEAWPSLIAERWTLVDDTKGADRRFVLAVENRAPTPGVSLLSPREREVVLRAHRGHRNKQIAYDLGLAQSTVRVLLARASTKVGARSRPELLRKTASLVGRGGAPGK